MTVNSFQTMGPQGLRGEAALRTEGLAQFPVQTGRPGGLVVFPLSLVRLGISKGGPWGEGDAGAPESVVGCCHSQEAELGGLLLTPPPPFLT